ncbi:HAD-IA family hydrolase [Aristophania vespae]|uniref:phosphoglycolate phosphatase n=1 Tax=Aristophania vespae TaxID=2697033 RepID=A0A6P1N9M5_9PROT|nr:HAD family hydrolase [Aristophania vespae]QHI95275.1 HAD-IA family hydrolase [Aristophania vespae]UMM64528.1 Phosphoglycolate phosphatase [Aristophania vespae]
MPHYPFLLIDYDGTLAETRPAILKSITQAIKEIGHKPPAANILETHIGQGGTLREFFRLSVPGGTAEEADEFARLYRKYYVKADLEDTVLFDNVVSTLEELKKQNHQLVVISNKHAQTLKKGLEHFGITSFFDVVIGAEEDKPRKPDPTVYTQRLEPLFPHVPLSDMLIVGDTLADLKFAQEINIASCWAAYGHGVTEACLALRPNFQINKFSDLPKLLRS